MHAGPPDTQLQHLKLEEKDIYLEKILVLGIDDAGKSTTFTQMKVIYPSGKQIDNQYNDTYNEIKQEAIHRIRINMIN